MLLLQIGQRVRVEGISDVAGMEQLQEIDPTLAPGAGEPREPVVADLRHVAVMTLVASARVVDRDVAADRQAGDQKLVLFCQEVRVGPAEQRIDLPGGDVDAPLAQLLQTDIPNSVHPIAIYMGSNQHWETYGDILYSVKTGKPAFEHTFGIPAYKYFAQNPEFAKLFNDAMTSLTASEVFAIPESYDFSSSKADGFVGKIETASTRPILKLDKLENKLKSAQKQQNYSSETSSQTEEEILKKNLGF